ADIFAVNTASTAHLLDFARRAGARTFVYASSGGVYGGGDAPLHEGGAIKPDNFYAASKAAAEAIVHAYAPEITAVVLRYFFIYGRGQRDMLVPSLVARIHRGEPVTLQGNDGIHINPIHAEDAAAATVAALSLREPDTINVAGPQPVTLRSLVYQIGALVAQPP